MGVFYFANGLNAQTINVPSTECLKNVTPFSYKPPVGLTLTGATWFFGDGSTSGNLSTTYVYKNKGTYTVKINATFSNGTSRTDSTTITIYGLPKTRMVIDPSSDYCLNNNQFCLLDSNKEASNGQTIVTRLIVWGDGAYINTSYPTNGQKECHKYALPDNYTIKTEVTDIYGCKSSETHNIVIKEQTKAFLSVTNTFKDCKTKMVCFKNQSSGVNVSTAKFKWKILGQSDDSNPYFNTLKCIDYTSNFNGKCTLEVTDANGCKDDIMVNYQIDIDTLPSLIRIKDSVICYSTRDFDSVWVSNFSYDKFEWLIDGTSFAPAFGFLYPINPKNKGLMPGLHTISCKITRGNCTKTLTTKLRILGPIADFSIFDANQCKDFSNKRPISFINESAYTNRPSTKFLWHIDDPYGDQCTTYRKSNKDTSNFCNYSKDYFAYHQFRNNEGSYKIKLIAHDTVSGCVDSFSKVIDFNNCNGKIKDDTFAVCQGSLLQIPLDLANPRKVSLDKGISWHKLPYVLPNNLVGTIDAWFIFETIMPKYSSFLRNDSMIVRTDTVVYYDTIKKKDYLIIYPINRDSVFFRDYSGCNYFKSTVIFANPKFSKGETLKIYWGDNQISSIIFDKDSTLDSLDHLYNSNGVNVKITVQVSNNYGCSVFNNHAFKAGYIVTFYNTAPYYCEPTNSCPSISIFDIKNSKNLTLSDLNGNLSWVLNNGDTSSSDMYPCFFLKKRGKNTINAAFKRPGGCSDTFSYDVFIQDLRANVKAGSRNIFCNELKQFFDSTTFLNYPNESIKNSNWDFGTGKFTNPVLNPFKSLSTSLPEIKVKHFITTTKGCIDTIEFTLTITGSHPYFTIKDTIACEYLDALFYNKSSNCGGYIWEFGDDSGTILPTNDKKDVRFLYNKPGRYLIKLNGYDSFYNPATKSTYFCNTVFPDPAFQKDSIRAVVVLPRLKSEIEAIDSICPNTFVDFSAKGNLQYENNLWLFETDTQIMPQPDTIRRSFSRIGINRIKSVPKYSNSLYNTCFDTAYKDIYVLDVKADFDMKEDNSGVFVLFNNKSNPINANFDWDFGDPASGRKNHSNEVHPIHNYGFDTGTFEACLIAYSPIGCRDTTCKTVNKQGFAKLMVFNVFTPGNSDGKNDNYDVIIIGEQYYHLRIYDRWGVLVYESFTDDEVTGTGNWNGKLFNTGPDCSDGTYYYIFDYQMNGSDEKETINGTVTLIR